MRPYLRVENKGLGIKDYTKRDRERVGEGRERKDRKSGGEKKREREREKGSWRQGGAGRQRRQRQTDAVPCVIPVSLLMRFFTFLDLGIYFPRLTRAKSCISPLSFPCSRPCHMCHSSHQTSSSSFSFRTELKYG